MQLGAFIQNLDKWKTVYNVTHYQHTFITTLISWFHKQHSENLQTC